VMEYKFYREMSSF